MEAELFFVFFLIPGRWHALLNEMLSGLSASCWLARPTVKILISNDLFYIEYLLFLSRAEYSYTLGVESYYTALIKELILKIITFLFES